MSIFDGEWFWFEPPNGAGSYGVRISGTTGICTKTNAPGSFVPGDVILIIDTQSDNTFIGRQMFTDASWYAITGRLEGDFLYLLGGGLRWRLGRVGAFTESAIRAVSWKEGNPEVIINGKLYYVHHFAGTVEQASKHLETRVSGDEKITTSTTVTHDDIFLVDPRGREMVLRLQNWNIACRNGHELHAVWLERTVPNRLLDAVAPRSSYVLVHNVTTDTSTWGDWGMLYPNSSATTLAIVWGIPILLAGVATAGIGFLLFIFPRRQYIKAREDIEATKSELMRLLKSD